MPKTLVIDDEPQMLKVAGKYLERNEHEVTLCGVPEKALSLMENGEFDLVLTDLRMPVVDGLQIVQAASRLESPPPVIVMTAFGTVNNAVDAMRAGAADYITKPFRLEDLLVHVNRVLEVDAMRSEIVQLREEVGRRYEFSNILARSKPMREVLDLVKRVAPTKATVLVLGKSGTGKELIARAIHHNSPRRGKPFLAVNCASLPESLLESELFGHVRGAFTGAFRDEPGLFRGADGGTLFLDEIGDVTPALQVRLLRALQTQEVRAVGSTRPVEVDVRIIAATNQDLEEKIAEGSFRDDLFYRLAVMTIQLPELRERREDVPLLARHFLDSAARESGKPIEGFSDDALASLAEYDWPGNVRELENVIERAVLLARHSHILPEDLPSSLRGKGRDEGTGNLPTGLTLQQLETAYIRKVMDETQGHRTRAAEILGIDRRTLYRKLKELEDEKAAPSREEQEEGAA